MNKRNKIKELIIDFIIKEKQMSVIKPASLLIGVLIILILLIETLLMFWFENVLLVSKFWSLILDPILLFILIFPFYYFIDRYKNELQQKVNERTAKLSKANEELTEKE
ncbi:MAG TPA: hypothetical protein DIT07_05185, partial [Sphingobacteriaceae bacterium]|nr:hypothetical protein [Sphingobacteriaceae bacterium]